MANLEFTLEELWWLVDAYQSLWDRTLSTIDADFRSRLQECIITCQAENLSAASIEIDNSIATLLTFLVPQDLDYGRSNRGRAILSKLFVGLHERKEEDKLSPEWENLLREVQDGHDASADDGTQDRAIA